MSPSDSPHHHSLAAPFMLSLCVSSLYSNIVLLSACQRLFALCIGFSTLSVCCALQLMCSTADDVLYSSTNNVFFLWSLQHSDLGSSVCLPTTLCCLLVCHCMFRAGRVDVKGWSSCRQVRRGCMMSAGRSVFWCPLVGAESDSCGRNGRWKGLIFRHNSVHVLNQGVVLKKSSLRGVHPGDFPSRQGENERRPISCAHSSWIKRSTLLCRKMTRVHPVVSFFRFESSQKIQEKVTRRQKKQYKILDRKEMNSKHSRYSKVVECSLPNGYIPISL